MAVYLLKLNFALMMLYGFYRLVMARDTFFGYRRVALLAILLVSMVVPLLDLQPLLQHNTTAVGMATVYADYSAARGAGICLLAQVHLDGWRGDGLLGGSGCAGPALRGATGQHREAGHADRGDRGRRREGA